MIPRAGACLEPPERSSELFEKGASLRGLNSARDLIFRLGEEFDLRARAVRFSEAVKSFENFGARFPFDGVDEGPTIYCAPNLQFCPASPKES